MTLSAIGTFEDALSNPVVPYFYPFDEEGNPEYYYVRVTSSDDVEQFTRESVPYIPIEDQGELSSVINNELSNPQFAEVYFDMSVGSFTYNFSGVTNLAISIAPDWDLVVTSPGAGSVTVIQLKPVGSINIPTNPGTILTIASSGVTSLKLRQRIYGSPNLWGSGYISSTFVAKTYGGSAVALNLYYSQSNGIVIDQLLLSASLLASGNYDVYQGSKLIPASSSAQNFPNAYIDIFFDLPPSVTIDITSVMVAFTGTASIPLLAYDQESNARQIDHLYHNAYPIVPVGGIIDYMGFDVPLHYYNCNGALINRIANNLLFQKLTKLETVFFNVGTPTFTVVDPTQYFQGMILEGSGVPASTSISTIVGTTVTMSNNATITGLSSVRFFLTSNGDGATTFALPDFQGYVTAGAGSTLFGASNTGAGVKGGSSTRSLIEANLPPHSHVYQFPASVNLSGGGTPVFAGAPTATPTGNGAGTSTAFSIVQQTALVKKCIRYQ